MDILVIAVNFLLLFFPLSIADSHPVNKYTVSVNHLRKQITFHSTVNSCISKYPVQECQPFCLEFPL